MSKAIGVIAGLIAGVLVLVGLSYLSYQLYAFYAPKYEEVRRTTYEQSRAFNEGMVRDLETLKLQYVQATPDQQAALKAVILHRFSVYPEEAMPPDLRQFYTQLRDQP